MKIDSKLLLFATCAGLGLVPLVAALQTPPPVQTPPPGQNPPPLPLPLPGKITDKKVLSFDELKWTSMPEIEGAQQAVVWGDPAKGAHRVLYQWPAGTKLEEHSHTFGDRGVIVGGTLTITVEGGTAKRLQTGSWYSLPGGTKHVMTVESSAPCLFYVEREGPFDIVTDAK